MYNPVHRADPIKYELYEKPWEHLLTMPRRELVDIIKKLREEVNRLQDQPNVDG